MAVLALSAELADIRYTGLPIARFQIVLCSCRLIPCAFFRGPAPLFWCVGSATIKTDASKEEYDISLHETCGHDLKTTYPVTKVRFLQPSLRGDSVLVE